MMVKYNFRYLLLIVIHRSTDPYLVKMKQTQQELYDSMGIDYYYLYRDPDIDVALDREIAMQKYSNR